MATKKKEALKHILIPEHIKLSEKEKKALMEKFQVDILELPKIPANDPAIAHLNVKEKDIIKIVRKSSTAGTTVFYRGVVNE
ncbi:MAG: DNA-directed RNA polymerase subunit H [Nanoarchaeota archaeon]|nr:DNA-directed RNA polymerase subunit H [DPANN group archaeon]MBL7116452.1 DNA-directed RNA polymerase subunit H [Nanoarchaeota archaeon]